MCRSLLEKVTRADQLLKVAEPELLVLFEEWLEELTEEAAAVVKELGAADPAAVARRLKIPPTGTEFLLNKLRREGRL
jgi:hypothetical protein